MIAFGFSLAWLYQLFFDGAFQLYAIIAVFNIIFCMPYNLLVKRFSHPAYAALFGAALWTAIEYYRCELFFLCFAWITPGTAFGPNWLLPYVGVYGVSFVIVFFSFSLIRRKTWPLAAVLGVLLAILGLARPPLVEVTPEHGIKVAILQSEECYFPAYMELTNSIEQENPDLIVWPEYSLPYDVRGVRQDYNDLLELCAKMNAVLVLGTKTTLGEESWNWHNTALALNADGVLGEYYKNRPVHFLNDGIPGDSYEPIKTELGLIGTPICFDCDYTEVCRRIVKQGAEFFAIPSFDAKSWTATQHLQHSELFKLRAVENGRWIALSTSSGVSQFIDPHGKVHQSIPPMEEGVIVGHLVRESKLTFYTRIGWLFPWLTMIATIGIIFTKVWQIISERKCAKPGTALTETPIMTGPPENPPEH